MAATRSPGRVPQLDSPPTDGPIAAVNQYLVRLAAHAAGANAQSVVNVLGLNTVGNTSGTSGGASGSFAFGASNNLTASQTDSPNRLSHTVMIVGPDLISVGVSTGGNTGGTTGLVASRAVFVGTRNVTLSESVSGQSATVSIFGPENLFSAGFSTQGNTAGDTGFASHRLALVGTNAITLSGSTDAGSQTISIIGKTDWASSNHSHGNPTLALTSLSGTTASNSAGFTLSLAAGPYLTTAAASDHSHGNPTLALTNLSGTTASNSAGLTLSLSAAAPGAGGGIALAAGTQTATSGTVAFVDSNGLVFGMSASTRITGSYTVPVVGTGPVDIGPVSGNGTATSQFAAIDHVHRGVGRVNIYPDPTLPSGSTTNFYGDFSIYAGANITFSTGGTADSHGAITINAGAGGGAAPERQYHEIMDGELLTHACSITGASYSKRPIFVPFWFDGQGLSVKTVEFYGSRPAGTSLNMTYGIGFYSMSNSTRLDLVSSTTNAISVTTSAQFSGVRRYQITGLSNFTLSEGRWIAALLFSGSNNSTAVQNLVLYGGQTNPGINGYVYPGTNSTGATSGTEHMVPFWGVYASTSAGFPASVHRSEISGQGSNNVNADIYLVLREL